MFHTDFSHAFNYWLLPTSFRSEAQITHMQETRTMDIESAFSEPRYAASRYVVTLTAHVRAAVQSIDACSSTRSCVDE